MLKERNDASGEPTGPQGTILFRPDDLAEVIASPSADSKGDVDRAALIGVTPPFENQRFVLKRGKTLIGRREDNDIILPDDSVSAQHAWVLHDAGRYRVINMLFTNGTFINDAKAHDGPLQDGDRVRFGRAEFVFRAAAASGKVRSRPRGVPAWVWGASAALLAIAVAALVLI